jgi:hypothetical protein
MRRFWLIIITFLFLGLAGLGAGFYLNKGLYEYSKALIVIQLLSKEQKQKAAAEFFDLETPTLYSGMLTKIGKNAVGLWGKKGPRVFETDENSVYSFFSICESLSPTREAGSLPILKETYFSLEEWSAKARVGDFATVLPSYDDSRKLREIYSYDWWAFVPQAGADNLKKQCERRI